MTTPRRDVQIADLRALASGVRKHLKQLTMVISGKEYGVDALGARLKRSIDSAVAVQDARVALADAVAREAKVRSGEAEFLAGLRHLLRVRYRNNLPTLGEFGLEPLKKRTPPTGEAELLRVLRLRATREKRKTRGKRQKAAIKGDVSGVVITPVVRGATKGAKTDGD